MHLSDFGYELPSHSIAQEPAHPRDSARLMLINRQTQVITHHLISDLPRLLPASYSVVANNTKVFPARLMGHKSSGGKVEVLLTQPLGQSRYKCIARPGLKVGDTLVFSDSLTAIVTRVHDIERTVQFNQDEASLRTSLSEIGTMPTPPYIKKLLGNASDYQTIYAKFGYSAAAPTAGLHFTKQLLKQFKQDHVWLELTLNVGLGTFLPVKTSNIKEHQMHAESYTISPTLAKRITHPVLAIGTTTLRALEANIAESSRLTAGHFSTSIFIYPPYHFRQVDALLTNFHLPGSTLLMLVSAFCSYPNTQEKFVSFSDSLLGRAYSEAIQQDYRFFSFGDAMLIL